MVRLVQEIAPARQGLSAPATSALGRVKQQLNRPNAGSLLRSSISDNTLQFREEN